MRSRSVALVGLALSCVSAQRAFAQGQCAQILQHGIWESLDTSDNVAINQEVANWACSARNRNANGSVKYGDFLLGFGSGSGSNDCSSSSGKYALSQQSQVAIRQASKDIVNAWYGCIINAAGAHASIKYKVDPNQFGIFFQVADNRSNTTRAQLKSLQNYACTIDRDDMERGETEGTAAIAAGSINPPNPVDGCNRAKDNARNNAAKAGYKGKVVWAHLSNDSDCRLTTQGAAGRGYYYIFTAKGQFYK